MKGRFDDFIEDMAKEIKPAAISTNELNLTNIGKKMEEELKKAFEANAKKPEEVKPTDLNQGNAKKPEDLNQGNANNDPTPDPDGAAAGAGSEGNND